MPMTRQSDTLPSIHVVDDDDAVRRAVALLLETAGWATATHESGNAFLGALPGLEEDLIACVLTDVRMPGLDGVALVQHLRKAGFARPIVVMTAHGDVTTAVHAMKSGANDFIEKPFDDDTLLAMIDTAMQATASGQGSAGAVSRETLEAVRRLSTLSPREREVLDLLVSGKPNKLVAHQLGISQRTAEVHRARLMERLGVRSLAEAVRLAVSAQLAGGEGDRLAC
ncbi:MAG: response regulator [Proteobacteria bacterium]|nr:response regulator [Pseudomonadota bacterium]